MSNFSIDALLGNCRSHDKPDIGSKHKENKNVCSDDRDELNIIRRSPTQAELKEESVNYADNDFYESVRERQFSKKEHQCSTKCKYRKVYLFIYSAKIFNLSLTIQYEAVTKKGFFKIRPYGSIRL